MDFVGRLLDEQDVKRRIDVATSYVERNLVHNICNDTRNGSVYLLKGSSNVGKSAVARDICKKSNASVYINNISCPYKLLSTLSSISTSTTCVVVDTLISSNNSSVIRNGLFNEIGRLIKSISRDSGTKFIITIPDLDSYADTILLLKKNDSRSSSTTVEIIKAPTLSRDSQTSFTISENTLVLWTPSSHNVVQDALYS